MKPMKLTDVGIEPATLERLFTDPNYVMQQKHDGARMVTVWDGETLLFTNDGVGPIKFSAAKLRLPALEDQLRPYLEKLEIQRAVFDGELIIETGQYIVFDLVELTQEGVETIDATRALNYRLATLESILEDELELVTVTPTAYSEVEKRTMWDLINLANVEGAVSKWLLSHYLPGTRTKEWVKHKLVKTADVVVTEVARTFKPNGVVETGSAELAVKIEFDHTPWTDGKRWISGLERDALPEKKRETFTIQPRAWLPIGSASLIGKDLTIDVGDVVEIAYLYWTGEAPIQPRIMRKRDDKLAVDCDLWQFPEYSRAVVQL